MKKGCPIYENREGQPFFRKENENALLRSIKRALLKLEDRAFRHLTQ